MNKKNRTSSDASCPGRVAFLDHSILPSLDARTVKKGADFLAIVSQYTRLRRAGRQYVGLCPFHSERHPSFYLEPQRKLWNCFGCNRGGDIFDFIMLAEGCDFQQALQIVSGFFATKAAKPPKEQGRAGFARPSHIARKAQTRADVLVKLGTTNRQLRAIDAVNDAASVELATACEPERGGSFTCTQRISRNGGERGERC